MNTARVARLCSPIIGSRGAIFAFCAALMLLAPAVRAQAPAAPLSPAPRFDFNLDGHPDLLWHNSSTGQTLLWDMNDQIVLNYGQVFATVSDTDWTPAAVADVNRDGHPDLLWENARTGALMFWLMGGASGAVVQSIGPQFAGMPNIAWRVASLADFNNDGHPDILWKNTQTGALLVWYLNGTSVATYGPIFATEPDTRWQVVGTADFNRDGSPDMVWQNSSTGEVRVWDMGGSDGTTVLAQGKPFAHARGPHWRIVGTGDGNHDGHPDLIWRNTQSGRVLRWLLDGARGTYLVSAGDPFASVQDTHWQIVGIH